MKGMMRVLRGLLAPCLVAAGLVATTVGTAATAAPANAGSSTPSFAWHVQTTGRFHQSAPVMDVREIAHFTGIVRRRAVIGERSAPECRRPIRLRAGLNRGRAEEKSYPAIK